MAGNSHDAIAASAVKEQPTARSCPRFKPSPRVQRHAAAIPTVAASKGAKSCSDCSPLYKVYGISTLADVILIVRKGA